MTAALARRATRVRMRYEQGRGNDRDDDEIVEIFSG
jgi:hypothetical protein